MSWLWKYIEVYLGGGCQPVCGVDLPPSNQPPGRSSEGGRGLPGLLLLLARFGWLGLSLSPWWEDQPPDHHPGGRDLAGGVCHRDHCVGVVRGLGLLVSIPDLQESQDPGGFFLEDVVSQTLHSRHVCKWYLLVKCRAKFVWLETGLCLFLLRAWSI